MAFENVKLWKSCAMAGIEDGVISEQGIGKGFQGIQPFTGRTIHLHLVKTADEHIGFEPMDNVFDPFVGTAADKNSLASIPEQQILFMIKGRCASVLKLVDLLVSKSSNLVQMTSMLLG